MDTPIPLDIIFIQDQFKPIAIPTHGEIYIVHVATAKYPPASFGTKLDVDFYCVPVEDLDLNLGHGNFEVDVTKIAGIDALLNAWAFIVKTTPKNASVNPCVNVLMLCCISKCP